MRYFFIICVSILLTACFDNTPESNAPAQSASTSAGSPNDLTVYKSPTCGCCGAWVDHLSDSGIGSSVIEDADINSIKARFNLPANARSCHTATSGEYVFEGHVPATVIKRFLANPPENAVGLVVPGMPIGSPGMEDGDRFQPYVVWLMTKDGEFSEYQRFDQYDEQFM